MKPFTIRVIRAELKKCPGVKEICPDVWTCRLPRMCANKAMKILYQFRRDEARLLLKMINDEAMFFAHRHARQRGDTVMTWGSPDGRKLFVEVLPRKKKKVQRSS